MIIETDHPKAGKVKSLGQPIKYSSDEESYNNAVPLLGQHTEEILISRMSKMFVGERTN